MSWFTGEGLSNQFTNFKDQITTFTKDVLTETTDEIEDPVGELRLAKQKIYELEKLEAHQRDEQEKVKQHKDELIERAETAEFQIATLSQEYRKLFKEKDEEVQILKEENVRLKEQLRLLLSSPDDKPPATVSNSFVMDGLHDDGMDSISDLISTQGEINKLSSEVAKLTAECQYWKEVAKQSKVTGSDDMESISIQLEELKHQLTVEQEQHQRELSALQHVHDENVQTLVRRHQAELEQQQPSSNDSTDLVDELAAKNEQLESMFNESTQLFEKETQSLKKTLEEKEKSFEEQQIQLKEDSQSLAASLAACQDRVITYQSRIDQLQAELTSSQDTVNSLSIKLTQEQQAKEELCTELDELRRRLATMNDEQVARVQQEREQMKEELLKLQQKISDQIDTISNLEHAHDKVNGEMEQMTLLLAARESDIVNLQSKKEEGLHHMQQQLTKELREAKLVNDKLQGEINKFTLSSKESIADKEVQTVANSDKTTEDLQKRCSQLEDAARESELEHQVSMKDEAISSLQQQVHQLTEALSDSRNCKSSSHLMKQLEDLHLKFEPLESRIVILERENKELTDEIEKLQFTATETSTSEKNQLQVELGKCSRELERLKTHLLQVEQENSKEIIGFQQRENSLQQKVMQAEEQLALAATHKDFINKENRQKVESLTEQLHNIAQQRDSISLQLNAAQEESYQLSQQVTNLQMVLEQFQKEQSTKLNSSKQMHEKELIFITEERNSLQAELEATKREFDKISLSMGNMKTLQEQLMSKEQIIKDLKQQVENFQLHLMNREQKFSLLSEQEESRVDKDLVKNLLLGYFTAASHKKNEVLKLIGSILGFSSSELEQITKQGSSGWINSLWRKATPPPSPHGDQGSFSKLFIKFLENESLKSSTAITSSTSYIDPRTDPDKPLLATAATITAPSVSSIPHRVPSLPTFVPVTNSYTSTSQVTDSNTCTTSQVTNSNKTCLASDQQVNKPNVTVTTTIPQNLILNELLNSSNV